jgi:hypothetical protein
VETHTRSNMLSATCTAAASEWSRQKARHFRWNRPRVPNSASLPQRAQHSFDHFRNCQSSIGLPRLMLLDSYASRVTHMLQQLLCAQVERGPCVKWRGWLMAVQWPGRLWLLRELREW